MTGKLLQLTRLSIVTTLSKCKMQNFSIIIPTLNEAENIAPLLQRITTMAEKSNLRPEVIFIDDGSADTTCKHILEYKGSLEVNLHQRVGSRGLAGAVVAGGKRAQYDNLVVMDADLSHPPEVIPQLILPLLSGSNDMVIGSRYTQGGSTPDWPFLRKLNSRLATFPAHLLTGIEDPLAGFFSVKKELLEKIDPAICGFKIGFELLYRFGDDIRTAEIPIRFTDRFMGKSKMQFPILFHYFLQLVKGVGINLKIMQQPSILLIGLIAGLLDAGLLAFMPGSNSDITNYHIVSFLITMHLSLFMGTPALFKLKQGMSVKHFSQVYRHFLLITLPCLFLHGGLLSILLNLNISQATTSTVLGLFTLCTWLLYCSTLPVDNGGSASRLSYGRVAVVMMLYTLILRLFFLGTTELLQEEAYYWNYAQHMAPGYLDHPPLTAALIWLGTKIFGNTEFGVRLGAFCCWFITAYFSYALTKKMFNAKAAINTLLLIATLPIFFASSLIMTPDAPLIACWAATLYFLYQALCKEQTASWMFAGLFFGIGLTAKYTIVLLAPATLFFMLIDPASRKWLWRPQPYLATIIALICFSPIIWWNFQNDWASFLFQSHGRVTDVSVFSTHKLIGSLILLLTPVGLIAALYSLFPLKIWLENSNDTIPHKRRNYLFCLTMTLTPFLVFLFFSFTKEIKLNWTGPIWLVTLPFMAYSIAAFSAETKGRLGRLFATGWPKTFLVLLFIYGIALHYLSIGLPGVPYLKNNILLGWNDFASQVEEIASTFEKKNGIRPIIVGMDKYRIASGISFYSKEAREKRREPGVEPLLVTGRHIFGLGALMFSYWHPPKLFSQKEFLVFDQSRIGVHPDHFRHLKIGDIRELSIEKHGKAVATFYYRHLSQKTPAKQ